MSNKRFPHILSKNSRNTTPTYVIYVDTETYQDRDEQGVVTQRFRLGCAQFRAYDHHRKNEDCVFFSINDFWNFVLLHCMKHKKLYIIAHNQDFDFRILDGFTRLPQLGFQLVNVIADGGKFIADYRYVGVPTEPMKNGEGSSLCFLDTLNWFHTSISSLGKTIGLEKMDMPSEDESDESWSIYCMRDVDILRVTFEKFLEFIKQENMGNFSYTLAKQALNAYRHRFMRYDIHIHTQSSVVELERESYFGGRTECFFIGEVPGKEIYKLDINSQYPYVMKIYQYPCKLIGMKHWLDREYFDHRPANVSFIAECDVAIKVPCIPYRFDHRLCFPIGTFRTTLCEPEYQLALREGADIHIRKIAYYEMNPIFREWIDCLYAKRLDYKQQRNDQYQYFCKLLMNSLYGKFGQRTEEWVPYADCDPTLNYVSTLIDGDTGIVEEIKALGGRLWKKQGWKEGFDSMVSIAAFVTSYARVYLWQLMRIAGIDNVYYCDTDSLFVNKVGYDNLQSHIHETELGKLKVEGISDRLIIHNLKDYEFGDEVKLKGIPKRAVRIDGTTYLCDRWEHISGAVRQERLHTVMVFPQVKHLTREYHKGVITPSGRVIPYPLENGQLTSV